MNFVGLERFSGLKPQGKLNPNFEGQKVVSDTNARRAS